MEREEETYEMKGGRVLAGADLDALADEAERGYDPAQFSRSPGRPGRPRMGSAPAVVLPVRLHPQLDAAVKRRAAIESTSVSELVRQAVKLYLEADTSAPTFASSADLERLADEAEAGYPVPAITPQTARSASSSGCACTGAAGTQSGIGVAGRGRRNFGQRDSPRGSSGFT